MKSKQNLIKKLNSFSYFSKATVHRLNEEIGFGLQDTTIDTYISRFLKFKDIISLKRGLYIPTTFYNANKGNTSYLFFLANILRKPSYVSSWTALQYYNLTTEVIQTVYSVTPKVTRKYKTKIGTFSYQSIKKDLFTNLILVKDNFSDYSANTSVDKGTFDFFIASPSKALFDLLYFKTRQFSGVAFKDINSILDDLRIDIGEMDRKEREKFYSMVKKYTQYE